MPSSPLIDGTDAEESAVVPATDTTGASETPAVAATTSKWSFAQPRPWIALLTVAILICAALGTFAIATNRKYSDITHQQQDLEHATRIASDYALAAAAIDFHNLASWLTALKTNADSSLTKKFTDSEPAIKDLMTQLQWVSSGALLGTSAKAQPGGIYSVQVFVTVSAKNVQSPDGITTTAVYPVTMDKNKQWLITDIGSGIINPLPK